MDIKDETANPSQDEVVPDANTVASIAKEETIPNKSCTISVKSDANDDDEEAAQAEHQELTWGRLSKYLRELHAERKGMDAQVSPHAVRLLDEGKLSHRLFGKMV